MRYVLAILVLLTFLPLTQANAQSWSEDEKPPVTIETDVVPVGSISLTAAAKDVQARKGLTFKQRRAMGITFRTVRLKLKELHAAGELIGKDRGTVALDVMDSLVADNPTAFADPSLDWDLVLEWIIRIITLLLMFI